MFNLLSNAIKFTPTGGLVKVFIEKISEDEKYEIIRFSVIDKRIGISLDLIYKQFNISMMGSKVTVESKECKGSHFYFDLKLKKFSKKRNHTRDENNKIKKVQCKGIGYF